MPAQTYAAPPTWTPPAPGAPTGPPPGGNFNSSKGKTIALIVGGVVAIGLLGGIAAIVLGGGDDQGKVTTVSPEINNTGILNPSPIGSASPQPDPGLPTPTDPTPTAPSPTPEPTPEPPPAGDSVTIGNGVQIFLPDTWQIAGDPGESSVNMSDGNGTYLYALTGTDNPSTDAGSIISGNLESLLPSSNYSQVKMSDISPLEPFGSVVSFAVLDYKALWVDSQGSTPLYGQIYAAVRQDGTVLVINPEHSPPDEYEASYSSWGPVLENSFNAFGSS